MSTNRFCYAVPGDTPNGKWQLIPDTPESRISAIENGARHFSIYSFSADPDVEKEVTRYGDLVIDFDSHTNPLDAVDAAQDFVHLLYTNFGVYPNELKYWLTGGKGAHLAIPAELFGGEDGDPELPRIHRRMLEKLTNNFSTEYGKNSTSSTRSSTLWGTVTFFVLPTSAEPMDIIKFTFQVVSL